MMQVSETQSVRLLLVVPANIRTQETMERRVREVEIRFLHCLKLVFFYVMKHPTWPIDLSTFKSETAPEGTLGASSGETGVR